MAVFIVFMSHMMMMAALATKETFMTFTSLDRNFNLGVRTMSRARARGEPRVAGARVDRGAAEERLRFGLGSAAQRGSGLYRLGH